MEGRVLPSTSIFKTECPESKHHASSKAADRFLFLPNFPSK
jgi:hypothetical protein